MTDQQCSGQEMEHVEDVEITDGPDQMGVHGDHQEMVMSPDNQDDSEMVMMGSQSMIISK